jgi:predicted nicotinamide N-methyase
MPNHTQHYFGLSIPTSQHPAIRRLKKQFTTQLHGNKPWTASYLLMDFLSQEPLEPNSKVLDIGCGWGLLSIYLTKLNHQVTAMDADPQVFPYLELLQTLNETSDIETLCKRFEQLTVEELSEFDVLLATDVCFWDEMADVHIALIEKALEAGVKKIIYGDPMRPPFLALTNHCVEQYFAEAFAYQVEQPNARGAIMLIQNA